MQTTTTYKNATRNQKFESTADTAEIQKIANTMKNMNQYLATYDLPKLNQKDIKKIPLNITRHEVDAVINKTS